MYCYQIVIILLASFFKNFREIPRGNPEVLGFPRGNQNWCTVFQLDPLIHFTIFDKNAKNEVLKTLDMYSGAWTFWLLLGIFGWRDRNVLTFPIFCVVLHYLPLAKLRVSFFKEHTQLEHILWVIFYLPLTPLAPPTCVYLKTYHLSSSPPFSCFVAWELLWNSACA